MFKLKQRDLEKELGAPTVFGVRDYAECVPGRAMSPDKLANVLREAAGGDISSQAALFEDMEEKDAHIFAESSKRKRSIASRSWSVQPGEDSAAGLEIADFCRRVLDGLDMEELVFDMADAVCKGFSCLEMLWDFSRGTGIVESVRHRPLGWFLYNPKAPGEIRLNDGTEEGLALLPGKWIVHVHKARSGSPYRGALYRVLAWLYLFRNYGLKSWARFVEGFGVPLRLGKYPPGTPEEEQNKLLSAVSAIATEAAVVIPEGMEIDVVQAFKDGKNPHLEFLRWSAEEISKAIVGSTLTSSTDGSSSYALGRIHNEVRLDILCSDAGQIQSTIRRQLIRPLVDMNFGPVREYPYLIFDLPKNEDTELALNIVKSLFEAGFKDIPVWWVREKFGIPAPGKNDKTLADAIAGN